jgi:hypothetical protein
MISKVSRLPVDIKLMFPPFQAKQKKLSVIPCFPQTKFTNSKRIGKTTADGLAIRVKNIVLFTRYLHLFLHEKRFRKLLSPNFRVVC